MFNLAKIINLSVVAIKGKGKSAGKYIEPAYILFSDGKTYIQLNEQDYFSYHDCSSAARLVNVFCDAGVWSIINTYSDATIDI